MKIRDLLKTHKIYWINLDKDKEKRKQMETLLDSIGVDHERISGVQCGSVMEGCAKSQLKILENYETPFTILEDDCAIVSNEVFDVDVDIENIDCLYLGMSAWGMPMNGQGYIASKMTQPTHVEKTDTKGLVKIHHMLATHAITYLNEEYKNSIIDKIKEYQKIPHHCDVACAEVQSDYEVYSLNPPLFFQNEPKNAPWTKFELKFGEDNA